MPSTSLSRKNQYLYRHYYGYGDERTTCLPLIFQVPDLAPVSASMVPDELICYADIPKRKPSPPRDPSIRYGVHFYIDDYRFNAVLNDIQRAISILRPYSAVLTPDYSLYRDMDLTIQRINILRNRTVGYWMQEAGLTVIPTVSWSDERSYEFCFDGLPKNSVLSVSSVSRSVSTAIDCSVRVSCLRFVADHHDGSKRLQDAQGQVEDGDAVRDDEHLGDGPAYEQDAGRKARTVPRCGALAAHDEGDDVGHAVYQEQRQPRPEMAREEHVVERKRVVDGKRHPVVPRKRQVDQRAQHHPYAADRRANSVEPVHEQGETPAYLLHLALLFRGLFRDQFLEQGVAVEVPGRQARDLLVRFADR